MVDDDLTALDLAMQLRSGPAPDVELPDELRLLMTAPVRDAIASMLLGEIARRIRRETRPVDQQNGRV